MAHKYLMSDNPGKKRETGIECSFLEIAYRLLGDERYREVLGFVPAFLEHERGTIIVTNNEFSKSELEGFSEEGYKINNIQW